MLHVRRADGAASSRAAVPLHFEIWRRSIGRPAVKANSRSKHQGQILYWSWNARVFTVIRFFFLSTLHGDFYGLLKWVQHLHSQGISGLRVVLFLFMADRDNSVIRWGNAKSQPRSKHWQCGIVTEPGTEDKHEPEMADESRDPKPVPEH